jgi:hypothetical protein
MITSFKNVVECQRSERQKKTADARRLVQGFSALLRLNLSTAGAA